ncbi:MAG: hypothetical protein IJV22_04645 [Bacteroidales bacterium]|nr:hypothetical protein [Bacteroidales bacterium]
MNGRERMCAAVVEAIGEVAAVSVEDLKGGSRRRDIVFCRFIVARELYKRTCMDYQAIAKWMGKDVGMIAYYVRRYEEDYNAYPKFRELAKKVEVLLNGEV